MNTLLLKKHFENAPRMEPQDAVKLAFQSAFGCGHLLPAQETCARMIETEIAATAEDENEQPILENIADEVEFALASKAFAEMMEELEEEETELDDSEE